MKDEFKVPVQLFELGQLVATPGVLQQIAPDHMRHCLARHMRVIWGPSPQIGRQEGEF
jgi:hypothetical protein